MPELTPDVEALVAMLIEERLRHPARSLLIARCTSAMLAPEGPADVEAVQRAVLRLSGGRLDRLERAIELAEYHWPTVVQVGLSPSLGNDALDEAD